MSTSLECPHCSKKFSRLQRLQSHMNRKKSCMKSSKSSGSSSSFKSKLNSNEYEYEDEDEANIESYKDDKQSRPVCPSCLVSFSTKYNLYKHMRRYHPDNDMVDDEEVDRIDKKLNKKINGMTVTLGNTGDKVTLSKVELLAIQSELDGLRKMESRLLQLENRKPIIEQHQHNNQILQVMCVTGEQNYLDMLSEKWGFDKALDYIKGCALSELTGDCRLLEKIYFEAVKENQMSFKDVPICYTDKNHSKIEYKNERNETIIDIKGRQLMKKIANNLQNSYLKGINHIVKEKVAINGTHKQVLEEFDVQTWNHHIYTLSDEKYQRKLLANLEIPVKT